MSSARTSLTIVVLSLLLCLSNRGAAAQEGLQGVCASQAVPSTVTALHARSALLRTYDSNCNGIIDRGELLTAEADDYQRLRAAPRSVKANAPHKAAVKKQTSAPPAAAAKNSPGCPLGWSAYPILRENYGGVFGVSTADCPPSLKGVKGAQFSWARDRVANNDQWAAKGVAGVRFMRLGTGANNDDPYVNLFAVAPVVRFQRVVNSNAKLVGKNVDVLSPGITSETLINQFLDPQLQIYVRGRGNANGNFDGEWKSWSGTLEVQPVYDPLRIATNLVVGYTFWNFAPVVRAQYFGRVGTTPDPLFLTSNRVFRAGPALSLDVTVFDGDPVPAWLRNFAFNVTYSWYHDFIQQRAYRHLATSINYAVTDNFGIALSYERGNIEENAERIDLITAAMTFKY